MTKNDLLNSIITDLGANYHSDDSTLLGALLDEVINDALIVSNRKQYASDQEKLEAQLDILASQIRRATKTIYLQRGAEDARSQSQSGLSTSYDNAIEIMTKDIIRLNKRVLM